MKLQMYLCLILAILLGRSAWADVPSKLLKNNSEQYATKLGFSANSIKSIEALKSEDLIIGYETKMAPQGFLLMRANTNASPIKIYAFTGVFSNLPSAFISIIKNELKQELNAINTLAENNELAKYSCANQWIAKKKITSSLVTNLENTVLLNSSWNQNQNYNTLCPIASGGPGGRAYAGCVATAISQIMNYHKYPEQGQGEHSYTDNNGNCLGRHACNFGTTTYAWNLMPNTVDSLTSTEAQNAVNTLIYQCGIAVNMDYEASGSGAYSQNVPNALKNYFRYDRCELIKRPVSDPNSIWFMRLKNEIDHLRPIYYSFIDQAKNVGHAVVCDGYSTDNIIHLNMGWSGSGNAWYNLDNINYGSYNFNANHNAVIGFAPPANVDDRFEINDTIQEAHNISDTIGDWISANGQGKGVQCNEDWYEFNLNSDCLYLTITCAFQNAQGNIELSLYQDNRLLAYSRTINDGEVINIYELMEGNYQILVDSNNGNGYPFVKYFWYNEYDLMIETPEPSIIFISIGILAIITRRHYHI